MYLGYEESNNIKKKRFLLTKYYILFKESQGST